MPSAALAWLYSTQQFGIKLGLENILRLLEALGRPQDACPIIHVAGTNGKGSVCAMLDAIARASGCRTGLYTSPHLVDFRERIRVDGVKIPPDRLEEILLRIRDLSAGWDHSPTFFEIATAAALRYFADERCELVILETGMGGRLDATNATLPRACVITPIALDHTQWLGDTLAAVAGEKAGIIKPGVPVLTAPQEPEAAAVFSATAAMIGAPLQVISEPLADVSVALVGPFQQQNAALAVAALQAAGFPATPEAITSGLRNVRWPGRFQRLDDQNVLDGAHNPHAARHLVSNWRQEFGAQKATIIFGALADKDHLQMLELLSPIAVEFLFVPVRSQRAASPEELTPAPGVPFRVCATLPEALATARSSRKPILITGSLFLVGEAMELLGFEP